MFPQELINRFIDEVSTVGKPSYYLPPTTRKDLQSCSLAAKCFRLQSQRHLLAHAEFFIIRGETQSKRVLNLREILERNEELRQCVIYLTIRLRAADPLNANDGVGDAGWKFHDENLPTVINMLAEIRHLNIRWEHLNVVEWDRLSEGIRTALRNTPSPHLSVLGLHRVSISPYYLVDTWKPIKEITLRCVEMIQMNMGEEGKASENAPSIPECRLERVNIFGLEFPLHHALNDQILGGLRHFRVELYRFCPYSIRQIWNVIHITSKSLESLDLAQCFSEYLYLTKSDTCLTDPSHLVTSIRPPFITMDCFPSLQSLAISDDIIGTKAFLDTVVPFFKLENPMSTSKLENLTVNLEWIMPIGSNSSYEDDVLLPSNGWHRLDALLTSSHYPSLRKVTIGICLSASWDWRLGEPERHARLWGIYRNLQSSCFPLLSCSDSIEFVFRPSTGYHTGF